MVAWRPLRGMALRLPVGILLAAVTAALLPAAAAPVAASASGAAFTPQSRVVGWAPVPWTPRINDGAVLAITRVGRTMVLGGTFSSVSPSSGGPSYSRARIVALDSATGAIESRFAPALDGAVNQLLPGPLPDTVLVAGSFTKVNGSARPGLALLNLSDGTLNPSFKAPALDGVVRDMERAGKRLVISGPFSMVGGYRHRGIASLRFTTGAVDPFINNQMTGNHNWRPGCTDCAKAGVGALGLALSPDGKTLIAIGNFTKVDGLSRNQVVNINMSGSAAVVRDNWATSRYVPACNYQSFDSYLRGVDFSPDGSYFVIVTSGGPHRGTLCDAAARFETSARGLDVQPTWSDLTGGDSLLSVVVTGAAIYAGGHQRWMNNDSGIDYAGPGAVPRAGLSAIDPISGTPLSWNPGRVPLGAGASALYATESGLWLGSDTERIGNQQYLRPRIAFFPSSGGSAPPAGRTPSLPADVFLAGVPTQGTLVRRQFDGSSAGRDSAVTGSNIDWAGVRGATQVDGTLFYGRAGMLYRAPFDGTSFGPSTPVDPYRDPQWCSVRTGSGTSVFCGKLPSFYGELHDVTAMAFNKGRLYYTLAGTGSLQYRWFSPESGIVGAVSHRVSGTLSPGSPLLMIAGGRLFYGDRAGVLRRVGLTDQGLVGPSKIVSGPGVDGRTWRAGTGFLGQRPGSMLPAAGPPSRPVITKVRSTGRTAVVVRWRAAVPRYASVTGYAVQVKKKPDRRSWKGRSWRQVAWAPAHRTKVRWHRGKAGAMYRVRVAAHSSAGSTASRVVTFRITR